MTRDEFEKQSDELFYKIRESLYQKITESAESIFSKATECPDKISALSQAPNELTIVMSKLFFEASCDYSEKLALLLFDHFSKSD